MILPVHQCAKTYDTLVLAHHFSSWAFNLGQYRLVLRGSLLFDHVFEEWEVRIVTIFGKSLVYLGDSIQKPTDWETRELILIDSNILSSYIIG